LILQLELRLDVFTEVASLGLYYGDSTWLSQWRNLARQGRIITTTTTTTFASVSPASTDDLKTSK